LMRFATELTQARVAQALGISKRTYCRIEAGERPMRPCEEARLRRFFGMPDFLEPQEKAQ
jgi:DNA-binding XRE family transcriptional regulator